MRRGKAAVLVIMTVKIGWKLSKKKKAMSHPFMIRNWHKSGFPMIPSTGESSPTNHSHNSILTGEHDVGSGECKSSRSTLHTALESSCEIRAADVSSRPGAREYVQTQILAVLCTDTDTSGIMYRNR